MEGLRNIIDAMQWNLFPSRSVPLASHPGYTTQEHDYFHIGHPDLAIQEALQKYFVDLRHRGGDSLFEGRDNLAGFFSRTLHDIYLYGKAFYAIEWNEVSLKGLQIILPKSFNSINALTTKRSLFGGFVQAYSLVAYYFGYHFVGPHWGEPKPQRTFRFTEDEIVHFKFPFGSKTPVRKTYKQVPKLRDFWKLGLDQGKSGLEPDSHTLSLEKARHTIFNQAKRERDIRKAKVRKQFGNTLEGDLNITQFYDVYTVARYKKYLNNLRNYYVAEFNNQVLARIAEKNKWEVAPVLTFDHFQTNQEIDQALQDFKDQKMDVNGFILAVVKKP